MCGRYVLVADPNIIQQSFDLDSVVDFAPRYNIAPTQYVPVITNEHPKALEMHRWGLIPSWAKDESIGNKMINARADGVAEKPSYRNAFKRRRCLVPASGFYEWQKGDGKTKTPMFIHPTDQDVFVFAGLWEVWHSADGSELRTFTIITTDANDFMRPIHDRMPVILHKADYDLWLEPGEAPASVLQPPLRGYESSRMTAYEVSRAVNTPMIDEPQLIQPVA
ncbi:MAG: SOS response-associated peptidase [Anaerolineae bacterium]